MEAGANVVAGVEPDGIPRVAVRMIGKRERPNPFGDGYAAEKIARVTEE